MAVDYDLVIVGSSWAGIYAAKIAVQLQARVALVTQCDRHYLPNDVLVSHSLSELCQLKSQLASNPLAQSSITGQPIVPLIEANSWLKDLESAAQSNYSLENLAALGVDVIVGKGKFGNQPNLSLQADRRNLRSRNFLLATGTNFVPSFADGTYLTLRDLKHLDLSTLPQEIIVVGDEPLALELAQTLTRFKRQVTLIIESTRILPQEDGDIAILIQAHLEAAGVKVITGLPASQIRVIDGQKWIQVGDLALATEEIILVNSRQPNIAGLNLKKVNVKCDRRRVLVNQKLQTTNPNIYACGDLIGGYCLPNIAQYEVSLILKNTLFISWYKVDYNCLPWAISTQPNLARVGLNEAQAKQQYGDRIYLVKEYFKTLTQAQISAQTSGICKLIVQENGTILGCSLVGDRAAELITVIALMIKHRIRLERNPMKGLTSISIPAIYPSMMEILQQASNNFHLQKLQRDPQLLKRLRTWFSLRKN